MSEVVQPGREYRPSPLSIETTLRPAITTYIRNFREVVRITLVWIVVGVPVMWYGSLAHLERVAQLAAAKTPVLKFEPSGYEKYLFWLFIATFSLSSVSIAVAWHRFILLGERALVLPAIALSTYVWRYIGAGLVVFLATAGLMLVVFAPAAAISAALGLPAFVRFLLDVSLWFVWCMIVTRASLLFPARAIGNTTLRLRESWKLTEGSAWRIFWGGAVCAFLPNLLAQVIGWLIIGRFDASKLSVSGYRETIAGLNALGAAYFMLALPIGIGFLSLAYRQLVEVTQPVAPDGGVQSTGSAA